MVGFLLNPAKGGVPTEQSAIAQDGVPTERSAIAGVPTQLSWRFRDFTNSGAQLLYSLPFHHITVLQDFSKNF